MKKQSKLVIGITGGILLIAVVVIIAVLVASGSDSRNYAKHMKSAQRYMDELQYEQAIAEYKAAIEIEPNNVEAYQALAELYVRTGDYEAAIAVLNQGMEQTGLEKLSDYIEEVQAAYEEQKALAEALVQEEEQKTQEIAEGDGAREETVYYGSTRYVYEYDAKGNIVKATLYNADGTVDYISEYDVNGKLVKMTWYHADGTVDYISEYDANGKLVKETVYNADGTVDYISECDANGNRVKETRYNADGTVDYYWIPEYDANGRPVKNTVYNADGALESYTIYEYGTDGYLVKIISYNADGTIGDIIDFGASLE